MQRPGAAPHRKRHRRDVVFPCRGPGLQIRDRTDKDGGKRRSAEVIANNVYFGDSKKDDQGSRPVSHGVDVSASDFAEISEEDGELPF